MNDGIDSFRGGAARERARRDGVPSRHCIGLNRLSKWLNRRESRVVKIAKKNLKPSTLIKNIALRLNA